MDLLNLAVKQESVEITIKHPATGEELQDDKGKKATVSMVSSDTNFAKKVLSDLVKEGRKVKRKSDDEATAQDRYATECRAIAQLTTGAYLIIGGKEFKHSVDAMFDLISKPEYTWLKNQLQWAADDRSNFITG